MTAVFAPDRVLVASPRRGSASENEFEAQERARRRQRAALQRERRPSFDHLAIGAPLTAAFIGMLLVEGAAVEWRGAADEAGIFPARGARGDRPGAEASGSGEGAGALGAGEAGTVAVGGAALGAAPGMGDGESAGEGASQAQGASGAGSATPGIAASAGAGLSSGGATGGGAGRFSLSSSDDLPSEPIDDAPGGTDEPGNIGKHVIGTPGDDVIIGTPGDDSLFGGPGDDIIRGLAGDDLLDGGAGDDRLFGGPGQDELHGGPGNDMLDGGSGNDELFGGPGNDRLFGKAGRDTLDGGTGNDLLDGGTGGDGMHGGAGDDIFIVDHLHDFGGGKLHGHALEHQRYPGGVDLLSEPAPPDDRGVTDVLQVNQGFADSLKSEFGEDAATFVMHDRLGAPLGDGMNGFRQQVDPDIERLVLKGSADHDVIGSSRDDVITGNAGDNVIRGGRGADILSGGGGTDELHGGDGRDRLFGDDGSDILLGGADQDVLRGGAGDDLLDGGTGADRLFGEAGNDTFHIGLNDSAIDTVFDHEGVNQVVVKGGAGHLLETAIAGDDLYIVADNNPIAVINGYRGQGDSFAGIDSGAGTTSIADLMAKDAGSGPALATGGSRSVPDAGDDLLAPFLDRPSLIGGRGDDILQGTSGADWLRGREGDDHLLGGAGRDVLEGNDGSDLLQGGADGDRYLFRSGETGLDTIRDLAGSNVAELHGFRGEIQGLIDGRDLLVVADSAPIFRVENFVGNEDHFAGVQRGDEFIPTDDLLA